MKLLIGVTGLGLLLYLIVHIVRNLMLCGGPTCLHRYADVLESNPVTPVIEIGLLLTRLAHVYKTVIMFLSNQQARPNPYVLKKNADYTSRKSLASSTMLFTDLWLLLFIVMH